VAVITECSYSHVLHLSFLKGVSALLPVGVTFLTEEVKFDAIQVGIAFAIALLTSLFGAFIGAVVTTKTNPRISWMWSLAYFVVVTIGGTFALVEERAYLGYVWGALWGIGLGWFYPVENLMFSLCLPKGSENEMTGLFIYTSQILAWLPPFAFSVIIESGQNTRWGFLSLIFFQGAGIGFLMCMGSWKEVLEETNKLIKPDGGDDDQTTGNGNKSKGEILNDLKEEDSSEDSTEQPKPKETSGDKKGEGLVEEGHKEE
jgi:MFS-type transporter involved in bile tolerance (Atg22 family)